MSLDQKFYGIYRGKVYDSNDPDNLGRIQLIVPQVLGQSVTDWAYPVNGAISQNKWPYGTWLTLADQAIGVNTPTVIDGGWQEEDANRTYLDGTRLYVQETGDYFLQFSAMITKTNASSGTADIWIRKNGTNIDNSNTRITLSGSNAEITMTVGLILDLEAGDYIQFLSSASASNTFISHSTSGVGPAVPGIIATLNLIGKWKPQPNTGVWVMFEGGDPNFPLWIGGQ
jgi:hypothetical protein